MHMVEGMLLVSYRVIPMRSKQSVDHSIIFKYLCNHSPILWMLHRNFWWPFIQGRVRIHWTEESIGRFRPRCDSKEPSSGQG